MFQVDLSTLSGPELRRLLDSSRARGQAALSYQILQEMAARREKAGNGARPTRRRRANEPHIVELDLGDPLEQEEDIPPPPASLSPTPIRPELETAPQDEAAMDSEPEPEPEPQFTLPPRREPPPRAPRRRSGWPGAGFVLGVALGAALGWGVATIMRQPAAPSAAPPAPEAVRPAPAPASTETASNQLAVEPSLVPQPPAETPAAAPAATTAPSPPPAQPAQTAAAPVPAPAEPAKPAEPASPAPAQTASTVSGACAAEPTPADRTICQDPKLQRLQRELRQAYAEALDAHQDRTLLREHQLSWRDSRSAITDPDQLARLYEDRIRKLKAATAAARQEQGASTVKSRASSRAEPPVY